MNARLSRAGDLVEVPTSRSSCASPQGVMLRRAARGWPALSAGATSSLLPAPRLASLSGCPVAFLGLRSRMPDAPPTGQRFSHVYIQRGEPAQESARMRRRLASLMWDFPDLGDFSSAVSRELGVDVPFNIVPDWRTFFRDCALQDVLDIVTVGYRYLDAKPRTRIRQMDAPKRWCAEVQRIFKEENVHYRVDERGGVHFRFDVEFEQNRATTIASLQGARYRAALTAFEGGMAALTKAPPDGKAAIRGTFAAAEGLFRLMFEKSPRLT